MSKELVKSELEKSRVNAALAVSEQRKLLNEQYFTPEDIAEFMAGLFSYRKKINILDPGAGVGNLGLLLAIRSNASSSIELTAVEIDPVLHKILKKNCADALKGMVVFTYEAVKQDFYDFYEGCIKSGRSFNRIILNPPYGKISSISRDWKRLALFNNLSPNHYASFILCCIDLLQKKGQLVAIIPRSFCNGATYKEFREKLISACSISRIHLFESRRRAFKESGVTQEVVIIKLVKGGSDSEVEISVSDDLANPRVNRFSLNKIIFPSDLNKIIHIPLLDSDELVLQLFSQYSDTIESNGIQVSTGKVVDFRVRQHLSRTKKQGYVRLVMQENVRDGSLNLEDSKSFIRLTTATSKMMIRRGTYIVVRRMSFKEYGRRIVACMIAPEDFEDDYIAIENHLNYLHVAGEGIEKKEQKLFFPI